MSSQLQVTGEAKIRDIQGPVVANDGVITALDGAASQYVRGDGTLADFPTSSGGGSSVSYYLNSSVSQGTIGGVAYRELSKDPIIGAGTDIAISSNGYVASYITDANDPDVVIVPGGNFNCEFYFSVNNNTGNPTTYAELYKYDGTTFTLLGTSSGVPESINQGTTIAPYYFAIPVATAALALTDRLAIRIYVNVDGRTVTLHTENSHLCQVVTTLSKGMVSLNNLTDQSQFLTTGTSGTNFAIVSSGDTHTFNLPVASATNTGKLSSTDWSTFNNKQAAGNYVTLDTTQTITAYKTFSSTFGTQFDYGIYSPLTSRFDEGILFLKGNTPAIFTDITTNLYSEATSNNLVIRDENSKAKLVFDNSTQTYTFPNASGTIALTSDLSGYVTLGTAQVITGSKIFGSSVSIITGSQASLSVLSSTGNSALILGYVNNVLKGTIDISATEFKLISAIDNILKFQSSTNFKASLIFSNTADYSYTYPNATGTIALTSNLSSYLPLAGGTLTGDLTIAKADTLNVLTLSSTNTNVISFITSSVQKGEISVNGSNFQFNSATTNGYIFKNSASNNVLTITDAGVTTLIGALTGTSATFSSLVTISADSGGSALRLIGRAAADAGAVRFFANNNTTQNARIESNSSEFEINSISSLPITFKTNDTTRLTIASTGAATFSSSVTAQNDGAFYRLKRTSGTDLGYITDSTTWGASGTDFAIGASSANMVFYTNNSVAERMRITSGGNVGIGTSSPQRLLHINNTTGGASVAQFTNLDTGSGSEDGLLIGITGAEEGAIILKENLSLWFATNDTERMRITSTGNVGIGTTAPQGALEVVGLSYFTRSSQTTLLNPNYGGAGTHSQLQVVGNMGLAFATNGDNERMRITNGGNVGIGTSSPSARLHVLGNGNPFIIASDSATLLYTTYRYNNTTDVGYIGNGVGAITGGAASDFGIAAATGNLLFATGGVGEKMRITSGGELYWNLTGASGGSLNGGGVLFRNNSGKYVQISTGVTFDTGLIYFYKSDGAGSVTNTGSIATSGNSTVYNTTSDYRLKQDFQDYNGLILISKIKTYDYEWKSDKTRMFGVIAHELAEVLPYAVTGKKDAEEMQSVDYSKLVPILVKSIQELQERIVALESK